MPSDQRPIALALMGPTASGKTAWACHLADAYPVQIISVDSALVYTEFTIGAAKPTQQELIAYPHALVNIRSVRDAYSAAQFVDDALSAMNEAKQAGKMPLLVGGTMLYYKALFDGLSVIPATLPAVREAIQTEAENKGWAFMHQQLADIDPVAAQRIHPNDPQRIGRALEVHRQTGRSLTQWQALPREHRLPFRMIKLAVVPHQRSLLHERIAQRTQQMFDEGLLDEVAQLMHEHPNWAEQPAFRSVGYRQVLEARMRSESWQAIDQAELTQRVVFATRQLAKRQTTWLRGMHDVRWLDGQTQGDALMRAASMAFGTV